MPQLLVVPTVPVFTRAKHRRISLGIIVIITIIALGIFLFATPGSINLALQDSYIWNGFHALETSTDGTMFRWTQSRSVITLPLTAIGVNRVSLDLQSGRNDATVIPVELTTTPFVETIYVTQELRRYHVLVTSSISVNPTTLSLAGPTFRPDSIQDNRRLGVVLHQVEIAPLTKTLSWSWMTAVMLASQPFFLYLLLHKIPIIRDRFDIVLATLWTPTQLPWLLLWGYTSRTTMFSLGITIILSGLVLILYILPQCYMVRLKFSPLSIHTVILSVKQMLFCATEPLTLSRWNRYDFVVITLIATLAIGIRIVLMPHTVWWINADDYMVGVVALRMLKGDFLLYYDRAGTLASVLIMPLLAFTGGSLPALLTLPVVLTAILTITLYGIGNDLYGKWGGLTAGIWMMLPSSTAMYWSTKTQPGYWESLTFAALALWGTVRLTSTTSRATSLWLALGIGLSMVCTLWSGLVSISVLLTCIWIIFLSRQRLRNIPLATWGLLIGIPVLFWLLPLLLYTIYNPYRNPIWWVLHGSNSKPDIVTTLRGFVTILFPRLVGAIRPVGREPLSEPVAILLVGIVCFAVLVTIYRTFLRGDRFASIPLVLTILITGIFVSSGFRSLLTDVRYVIPFYIAIPLLLAVLVKTIRRLHYGTLWANLVIVSILITNIVSSFADLDISRVYTPRHEFSLAQTLQKHNIRYVYASYWIGMGIMFESNNTVIASSLLGPTKYSYDPSNEARVLAADTANTAFIFRYSGISTPGFNQFLLDHDIECDKITIADYYLYLACTPFPDNEQLRQLSSKLPEALE